MRWYLVLACVLVGLAALYLLARRTGVIAWLNRPSLSMAECERMATILNQLMEIPAGGTVVDLTAEYDPRLLWNLKSIRPDVTVIGCRSYDSKGSKPLPAPIMTVYWYPESSDISSIPPGMADAVLVSAGVNHHDERAAVTLVSEGARLAKVGGVVWLSHVVSAEARPRWWRDWTFTAHPKDLWTSLGLFQRILALPHDELFKTGGKYGPEAKSLFCVK